MDERERFKRAEEIFLAAAACEGDERDAVIRARCAGDAALESDVRGMLAHDQAKTRPLDRSAFAAVLPASVGGYRILRKIEAGGMG